MYIDCIKKKFLDFLEKRNLDILEFVLICAPPMLVSLFLAMPPLLIIAKNFPSIIQTFSVSFWDLVKIFWFPAFLLIVAFIFLLCSTNYHKRDKASLLAEKDEFRIWGAIGSFGLVLFQTSSVNAFQCHMIIGAVLYFLWLMAFHYRRLSEAIYRLDAPPVLEASATETQYIITVDKTRQYIVAIKRGN